MPPTSSSARRTPAWYAMPTVPPAPSTSPSVMSAEGTARIGSGREIPAGSAGFSRPEREGCDLLAVGAGGQVLGHGPPEGDEAVAPVVVELVEVGGHVARDRL